MWWIVEVFNKIKDLWENGLKEFVIYAAIFITFVLSGLLKKLYHTVKNAILGLFTVEGAVAFIIAAVGVIYFLSKIGIL